MQQQQVQQLSQQLQPGLNGGGQAVPMFKNGKRYSIPADKVEQALAAGFMNE